MVVVKGIEDWKRRQPEAHRFLLALWVYLAASAHRNWPARDVGRLPIFMIIMVIVANMCAC
jgi:hypothetical protein